ncbi:MAG: FmdE family protein [Chloroflexales bacterium]
MTTLELRAPPDLAGLLAQSAELHKHLCPRQVIGARMGLYAGALLGLELPQSNKRLVTFVETDGCFTDGVSVATGCWMGRRTMRLVDYGKVAATFVDTQTGRAMRIWPSPTARALARRYTPAAPSRWHAYMAAYQVMPDDELLETRPVTLSLDLKAIISRNGVRAVCGDCGEEILNEREIVRDGQTRCRSCADGAYYRLGTVMEPGR